MVRVSGYGSGALEVDCQELRWNGLDTWSYLPYEHKVLTLVVRDLYFHQISCGTEVQRCPIHLN